MAGADIVQEKYGWDGSLTELKKQINLAFFVVASSCDLKFETEKADNDLTDRNMHGSSR